MDRYASQIRRSARHVRNRAQQILIDLMIVACVVGDVRGDKHLDLSDDLETMIWDDGADETTAVTAFTDFKVHFSSSFSCFSHLPYSIAVEVH